MADPNYMELFYNAYNAARLHVPQERKNPFEGTVTTDVLRGEQQSYDDFGISNLKQKTTRFATVETTDNDMHRRWLFANWYYDAKLVDRQDNIALLSDPTGDFIKSLAYGVERLKRDVILKAFEASVSGGKNPGQTSYSFSNTAIGSGGAVIVHDTTYAGAAGGTSKGLSTDKLILIRETFSRWGVPDGVPIYLACTFRQKSDLLREQQTKGQNTSEVEALVDGRINRYMGINFVETNGITLTSNGDLDGDTSVFKCYAYIPEGIVLATSPAPNFAVDKRAELVGDTWQIRADFAAAAIRRNENMVIKVECANTAS